MSMAGLSCSFALNGILWRRFNTSAISASAHSRLNPYKALLCGVLRPASNYHSNKKCRWRDLNPQGLLHTPLKRARIPIPPHRHIRLILFLYNVQSKSINNYKLNSLFLYYDVLLFFSISNKIK